MKTSCSFVSRVFLHSLNQPKAFCSACGGATVLACSSPPLHLLLSPPVSWSQGKMLHKFWQDLSTLFKNNRFIWWCIDALLLQVTRGEVASSFPQTWGEQTHWGKPLSELCYIFKPEVRVCFRRLKPWLKVAWCSLKFAVNGIKGNSTSSSHEKTIN